MALLTAQGIANVAIPLIVRQLVLPRTFTMVPSAGFTGPNGETITVRVRTPRTAHVQATPGAAITYDDQSEVGVDVALTHLYDAYHLTDEADTLELEDFASQITAPQTASVAEGAEGQGYAAMNDLDADGDIEFALTPDPDDTKGVVYSLREQLSVNRIPASSRWLAAAPDIITRLLNVDEFVRADALGDGQSSALRDAVVGRIAGFNTFEAVGLDEGTAVAYHSSGFVWANRRPTDPRGATSTATASREGINIRQIFQYDPDVLSDASVLSTFAGAAAVHEDEAGTEFVRSIKVGTSAS